MKVDLKTAVTLLSVFIVGTASVEAAEIFRAKLNHHEISMALTEGFQRDTEPTRPNAANYLFYAINKKTGIRSLEIILAISASDLKTPPTEQEIQNTFAEFMKYGSIPIPSSGIPILLLEDMNPNFNVHWGGYYHLRTNNPRIPFTISKATVLINKATNVQMLITMGCMVTDPKAGTVERQGAENFMDEMLVSIVKSAALTPGSTSEPSADSSSAADDPARAVNAKGLEFVRDGQIDEGLGFIRQAIQMAPKDGRWHMNYGSALFMKGKKVFEASGLSEAKDLFVESEKELRLAIDLFKLSDSKLIAHCYFLMGDIYRRAFSNKTQAKLHYKSALEYDPEHGGAAKALKEM